MVSKREDLSPTASGDAQEFRERRSDFGFDFIVEKTTDAIVLSGTVLTGVPLSRLLRLLKTIEQYFERSSPGLYEVALRAGKLVIMRSDAEPTTEPVALSAEEEASLEQTFLESEDHFLKSDNLIPVPPQRSSRTRKVRLIKRGKDQPQPAEDPWA